jgi:hypothetical protein
LIRTLYRAIRGQSRKSVNGQYQRSETQLGRCSVYVYKENILEIHFDEFQGLVQELGDKVVIQKKVFVNEQKLELEFICDNECYIGIAKQFAKEHKCEFKVFVK